MRAQPRYIQAEERLRNLLETGGYRPGDKLPPEPELARQIGVSRATLREALRSFEQQGLIQRKQGVGTFINPRPVYAESGLENLESIEMVLRSRQFSIQVLNRTPRAEKALPKAAQRLAISENTPLTVVSSTYVVNGQPVAFILEVVPELRISLAEAEGLDCSFLNWILVNPDRFPVSYAIAHISPVHGSHEICTALRLGPEDPLFFVEQTVHDTEYRPFYYSRNYYVPSYFDFHVIRRRLDSLAR
jgi:GntR family transcriptional regulator